MNDLISGIDAAYYASKLTNVENISTSIKSDKKIFEKGAFPTKSPIAAACGLAYGSQRSMVIVDEIQNTKELHDAIQMRIPLVICKTNYNDLSYFINSKVIVFLPQNSEEALHNMLQLYKICEDNKVYLPGVVAIEREDVRFVSQIPTDKAVETLISNFKIHSKLDAKKPAFFNYPNSGAEFIIQQSKAIDNSNDVIKKTFEKWEDKFKKPYATIEEYKIDDAEIVFLVYGYNSSTVKSVVDKLRLKNEKVGMARILVLNPFDEKTFEKIKLKKIIAIDSANILSFVKSDISFITLQKIIKEQDLEELFEKAKKSQKGKFWV